MSYEPDSDKVRALAKTTMGREILRQGRARHVAELKAELAKLERPARVHIAHMKTGLADTILREVERLALPHQPAHLARGQVLEF